MASNTRDRMVEGAARLLAENGLEGTSFSEVLEYTGAPRGSLYHHFPDGKDEMVASAVDLAGARALTLLESWRGLDAEHVTANFIGVWRETLTRSDYRVGCAVLAVTVAIDSPQLLSRAAAVFRSWRGGLAELLSDGGMPDAEQFAALLVASCEGAVVMSRAEKSLDGFEAVAARLLRDARERRP